MYGSGDKQMKNKAAKETRIQILNNRIRACEEAQRWCRANGRSTGPTSREIWAAIQELKALEA